MKTSLLHLCLLEPNLQASAQLHRSRVPSQSAGAQRTSFLVAAATVPCFFSFMMWQVRWLKPIKVKKQRSAAPFCLPRI